MTPPPIIGIRSSSCVNEDGLFTREQLSVVKDAGFDLLELNLNHTATGLDHRNTSMLAALGAEAERIGIALTAHAPSDVALTAGTEADDERVIGFCAEIVKNLAGRGISGVVFHPCTGPSILSDPGKQEARAAGFARRLKTIARLCEDSGVTLLLETMIPGRLSSSMDNLIRAVDAVGSERLKICLDTNHLCLTEDICAAAERAGARIGEIHLNDSYGKRENHLLPYSGVIDWHAFAETLSRMEYRGNIIMEPSWLQNGDALKPGNAAVILEQARAVADRFQSDMNA